MCAKDFFGARFFVASVRLVIESVSSPLSHWMCCSFLSCHFNYVPKTSECVVTSCLSFIFNLHAHFNAHSLLPQGFCKCNARAPIQGATWWE